MPITTLLQHIFSASPGVALIHSSFAKLMPPDTFKQEDILDTISTLANSGWTLAFPAFTFSFCHGKRFDRTNSASETGILADWVLHSLPNAVRSQHPVYSFVAVGPRANEIAACPSTTSFGDDTPFAFFERVDAWQIALGNGIRDFTQCHRYEELNNVPYRYWKEFTGDVDLSDGGGFKTRTVRIFVLDLQLDAQRDWNIIFDRIKREGCMDEYPLWRGKVQVTKTHDIKRVVNGILAKDSLGLLQNAEDVRQRLQQTSGNAAKLKVAILGHSNTQLLYNALEKQLVETDPQLVFRLYSVPYNQIGRELSLVNSDLVQFSPNVSIFCDQINDLFGGTIPESDAAETIVCRVQEYSESIAAWAKRNGGWIIVSRFSRLCAEDRFIECQLFDSLNTTLQNTLSTIPNVIWVDMGGIAAELESRAVDPRLWLVGRFPFSQAMTECLARQWTGLLIAISGRGARVLVLDLDDTLWGGVLGEDGIHNLQVGSDYPGNAFRDFQSAIRKIAARGVVLTVASKNECDSALHAMETLPDMLIRPSDLAAHRIGWTPKYEGIKSMVEELNLGLGSFLFIDNDPVERKAMRTHLPEVKVLEMPNDPSEWVDVLLNSPWLARIPMTNEDLKRNAGYRTRTAALMEKQQALTPEQFYSGLNLRMKITPLSATNIARAEQLCQKTNQFNASGKRYHAQDLLAMSAAGESVFLIDLTDKYAEHGNIGLLVCKKNSTRPEALIIDTYLLSCRVLGRGIEEPVLYWAMRYAKNTGLTELAVDFRKTEKNTPVTAALSAAGLRQTEENRWTIPITVPPQNPKWLSLDDFAVFHEQEPLLLTSSFGQKDETCEVVSDSPPLDTVRKKVLTVLQEVFESEAVITEGSALGITPGWDSMRHFMLVLAIEKAFDVQFSAEEMSDTTSVEALTVLCGKKISYE